MTTPRLNEFEQSAVFKLIDMLIRIAMIVAVAWVSWIQVQVIGMDRRVTVIESNRFTAKDALESFSAIQKDISTIREAIAAFPKEVPPSWFREEVARLEVRVQALERRLPDGAHDP